MRSPKDFIVKPVKGRRYDNTKNIGGKDILVSTSEEDYKFSNRLAIVQEVPLGYTGPVKKGDTLLVHHNVFKFYNDMRGRQQSGKSFFKDDLFFIDNDQFFLYKQKGKWKAYDRYCFIKPIPIEKKYIDVAESEEPLWGIVKYGNKQLERLNILPGDKVSFR